MKKIIIVANTSWFINNFFISSVKTIVNEGYEVYVAAPFDDSSELLVEHGIKHIPFDIDRSGYNPITELKTIYQIFNIFLKEKPDCVLNFTIKVNIYSTWIARLLSIPVINTVAGLGQTFIDQGFKGILGKFLLKISQPFANHIIFQNNHDLETYIDYKYTSLEKSSKVNGIGIDLNKFVLNPVLKSDKVRFIVVSRMLYSKGIREFVEAAKIIKASKVDGFNKFEFSLLGSPDLDNPDSITQEQLDEWHNDGAINYIGYTNDVFSIVKDYDCVVLPSYYREGVPQCLIEAAAMGKPIITTDNPGCRDTVDNEETGFLINPKDTDSLVHALLKMVSIGHENRLEMGRKGRVKAENEFCHSKISKHYVKEIAQVISR